MEHFWNRWNVENDAMSVNYFPFSHAHYEFFFSTVLKRSYVAFIAFTNFYESFLEIFNFSESFSKNFLTKFRNGFGVELLSRVP